MYKNPNIKPLAHDAVKLLIIHCVANKCTRPFETKTLINCGVAKYGQPSYHYYVRRSGEIIAILPENARGAHAKHYNSCSLGIVYEGGVNERGKADNTRTEAQKNAMFELLKDLTEEYPEAHILGTASSQASSSPAQISWPAKNMRAYNQKTVTLKS